MVRIWVPAATKGRFMIIQMGIVGVLLLVAIWLSDLIWSFVTSFINPLVGGLGLASILIGFALWFLGVAFMAFVILWLFNHLGVR